MLVSSRTSIVPVLMFSPSLTKRFIFYAENKAATLNTSKINKPGNESADIDSVREANASRIANISEGMDVTALSKMIDDDDDLIANPPVAKHVPRPAQSVDGNSEAEKPGANAMKTYGGKF